MSVSKALACLPGFYFAISRINNLKDLAYLIATSWIPAVWFLSRSSSFSLVESSAAFCAGYVAFISLYEIGYLTNDRYGQGESDHRQRVSFQVGAFYTLAFVVIRVATWVAIGITTGWITSEVWLACFAALGLSFALHNAVRPVAYRSASFFQLAVLRFVTPVVAMVQTESVPWLIIVAVFLYAYLRFLSYLESKGLLYMPLRQGRMFGLVQIGVFAPILMLFSVLSKSSLVIELFVYFLVLYLVWACVAAFPRSPRPHP